MPRPASTSLRFLRSLVALVTVWCTGCSGFEPVLGAIAGEGAPLMSCASESRQASNASTASSAGVVAGGTSSEQATVSAGPRASSQGEFSCGCSSCHAVELAHAVIPTLELAAPTPVVQAPSAPMSVGRTPLLPPPERTVL